MPLLETAPAIEPHITHLHLAGHVAPQPGEEYLYLADQLPALELLTSERLKPQAATVELVTTDGVSREVTVVNMLMEAYTRFGKFEVITADFRRYKQEHPEARGLYLAHATVLPRQSRMKFDGREMQRPPELRLTSGEFHGLRKDDTDVDMLFATIQSMAGIDGYRFPADYFDYIIVDEGHHTPAPTFKDAIVNHFKPKVRTTITGTLNRLDGLDITKIYGQPVVSVPLAEGFVRRRVRDLVYKVMLEESVRNRVEDGESTRAGMNRMTRSLDWNLSEMILRAEDEIAKAGIKEPKVLHFAQNITQAEDIAALLGPDCVIMHSEQSDENNEAALQSFSRDKSEGGVSNIVSVNMLNEGVDISSNVIAFYRSTESEAVLLQQLGRGLQIPEDGSPLLVLDFVANAKRLELLYNLIYAITNYTLEADQYQLQPSPEEASIARELEAVRGFGAEFDLDEELLEVLQSIADHKQYMEKIAQFGVVTDFEARAYLANNIDAWNNLAVKNKINDAAKRGEGPSLRAIMAATGQTLEDLLATTPNALLFEIRSELNNIELGDLLILMVQDIIMRHPQSQHFEGSDEQRQAFLSRHLFLPADYDLKLWATIGADMISLTHGSTHSRYTITPTIGLGAEVGDPLSDGWNISIETADGKTEVFYPSAQNQADEEVLRTKLFELVGIVSAVRQELQASGQLADKYPFYARRNCQEARLILDRFRGEDPVAEWVQYKEGRSVIKRNTRYINMLKQAMKLSAEMAKDDYGNDFFMLGANDVLVDDYRVRHEPETQRIILEAPERDGMPQSRSVEIDISAKVLRVIDPGSSIPVEVVATGFRNTGDVIRSLLDEMFRQKMQYLKKFPNHIAYTHNFESGKAYGQEWLEIFAAKVNASQNYIDDNRLPDFDPFGDEIIGTYVQLATKRTYGKVTYSTGIVTAVDYQNGTII